MKKSVTILGSTGSIGKSTIKLLLENPDKFEVAALTSNNNIELLAEQVKLLKPKAIALADESRHKAIRELLPDVKLVSVSEAAAIPSDIVIVGIVGFAGLEPTMRAIERGARIGLANKEAMVCAGEIMLAAARKSGAAIIPVDSEHNAIHQVFDFVNPDSIEKIILTASGGPFLKVVDLANVTPEQATNHPNWKMGAKISVDSATMMNKGLELIEAKYLFSLQDSQLDVVIHPESVIHSLVMYHDGSVLAQAANPDMCVPISYVLGYPQRLKNNTKRLDLTQFGKLHFEKPDYAKFPCLNLAIEAMRQGQSHQIVLNAANEVAVAKFLAREIKFTEIAKLVENMLEGHKAYAVNSLQGIIDLDMETRSRVVTYCNVA